MASPEEITPLLPETLPEDFSGWDGQASAAAAPADLSESKAREAAHSPGETSKPVWQSADRDAVLESLMDRPRVAGAIPPAPVVVKQKKDFIERNSGASPTTMPVNPSEWAAWEAAHSFGKSAKAPGESAKREASVPPVVDKPRATFIAPSAPPLNQQRDPGERNGDGPRTTAPVNSNEWKTWDAAHSFSGTAKPHGETAKRETSAPPVKEKPRVAASAAPAPVSVQQQKDSRDRNGGASHPATPVDTSEWKTWEAAHSFAAVAKPHGETAKREASLTLVADKPSVSVSASSAAVLVQQKESTGELADESRIHAVQAPEARHTANQVAVAPSLPSTATSDEKRKSPELAATFGLEADKALFESFRSSSLEIRGERKTAKGTWVKVGVVGAGCLVLSLAMVPLFHHGTKSAPQQAAQPVPEATEGQPDADTPKPSAGEPVTADKPQATAGKQQATNDLPNSDDGGTNSTQVQAEMMNDQLDAPTRIPKQVAENGPPPASVGVSAVDGLGGGSANQGLFNGHSEPAVKAAISKPIAISTGVATGLLIQKTAPIYPPIAREARVSGTVELQAVITKNGTIKDLHVMNGPAMLRQAAVDAVRTWRYKPYKLNNQPTEVETTIRVIFSLGG